MPIYRTVRSTPSATGLKTVLRDYSTGTEMLWNTVTPGFEAYNAANIADYGIACPEGSPGNYAWAVPATLASSTVGQPYIAVTYTTVTGTLAVGDLATPVNAAGDAFDWDGALPTVKYGGVVMTCSDASLPALSVHATGSGNPAMVVTSDNSAAGQFSSPVNFLYLCDGIAALHMQAFAGACFAFEALGGGVDVGQMHNVQGIATIVGADGELLNYQQFVQRFSDSAPSIVLETVGSYSHSAGGISIQSLRQPALSLDGGISLANSNNTPTVDISNSAGNYSLQLDNGAWIGGSGSTPALSLIGDTGKAITITANSSDDMIHLEQVGNGNAILLESGGPGMTWTTAGDGWDLTATGIGINVAGNTGASLTGTSGDALDLTGVINALLAVNSANGAQLTVADFNGNGAAFASQTGSTVRLGDFGGAGMSLTGSDAAHDIIGTAGDLRQDFANVLLGTAAPGAFPSGSVGYLIGTYIDALISSRAVAGDEMDLVDAPNALALAAMAVALLKADGTGITGEADLSLLNAKRSIKNKWSINTGTGVRTVYKEDGTTVAFHETLAGTAGADPVTALTP